MQSTPAKRSKSPQTDCHPPKIPRCNLKPKRHHREHRCWSPKNDTLSPDFLAKPNRYSAFLLAVLHRFHFSDSRSQTAQIVLRALSEHADLHAKHRNPEAADRCRTADNRCNLSSKRRVLSTDRGPTYVAGPVEYPMSVGLDSYLLANPRSVASLLTMSDPIRPPSSKPQASGPFHLWILQTDHQIWRLDPTNNSPLFPCSKPIPTPPKWLAIVHI